MKIELVRSRRKTLSLQIRPDGTILVRAPLRMSQKQIMDFVQEKQDWLEKRLALVQQQNEAAKDSALTEQELAELAKAARTDLTRRTEVFAQVMGVTFGRISIRSQSTRWGSCSSTGNLNYNCLLMLAPEYVRDYVVVHELAHRKQMNHSAAFWAQVSAVLPEYQQAYCWLKTQGPVLQARMRLGKE